MLIQVVLTHVAGQPLSTNQTVPFSGLCDVKILQVDIYTGSQNWFTITSNTLLKPPYMSKMIFSNHNGYTNGATITISDYMGKWYKFENVLINEKIDFKIFLNNNGNINFGSAIIWLDIEYAQRKLSL